MARTKNRFNAVQILEAVTAWCTCKAEKILSCCTLCQIVGGTEIQTSESIANQLSIFKRIYQG